MKNHLLRWFVCRDIPGTVRLWPRRHDWVWTNGTVDLVSLSPEEQMTALDPDASKTRVTGDPFLVCRCCKKTIGV